MLWEGEFYPWFPGFAPATQQIYTVDKFGFSCLTVRKIAPTLVSCTVCPNLCFIPSHTPQFEGKRNRYQMWQVYGFFPLISDCSFCLGRAEAPFKSFSPLFLRNLSLWHVCQFSQCSSKSLQFSHNGSCWQVVRADSEYVWKTVKLVKKN